MLRSLIFILALFSLPLLAGDNGPFDITGKMLTSGDRPILISTYEEVYRMFRYSASMNLTGNEIGFINAAVIDLLKFSQGKILASGSAASAEESSMRLTNFMLALSSSTGHPLEFNGRVILDFQSSIGQMSFEYNGGFIRYDPSDYGELLGRFFLSNRIKVRQLDLFSGAAEGIVKAFFEGLKRSGLQDFEVRSVRRARIGTLTGQYGTDNVEIRPRNGEPARFINMADYFVRGDMSAVPDEMMISLVHGAPQPVTAPQPVDQPGCQN